MAELSAGRNDSFYITLVDLHDSIRIRVETEVEAENSRGAEEDRSVCLQISEAQHGLTYICFISGRAN
jgi:hypothetical protein